VLWTYVLCACQMQVHFDVLLLRLELIELGNNRIRVGVRISVQEQTWKTGTDIRTVNIALPLLI